MATWQTLRIFPEGDTHNRYIIIKHEQQNAIYGIQESGKIFKYSHHQNAWNKKCHICNKLPTNFFNESRVQAAGIDPVHNRIYILNAKGTMATLEMRNNDSKIQWKIMEDFIEIGYGAQGIMNKDEFHAIGGWAMDDISKHVMYDNNEEKLNIFCSRCQRMENLCILHI